MKRRNFLRTGALTSVPVLLNGMKLGAVPFPFSGPGPENDRVLVLIQLNGGNDGLNCVIPLDQYSALSAVRPNILIPEANVLQIESSLGLHPSMSLMRDMYMEGQMAIVQGVGYPNQDRSHFRSTDIWTSGSKANDYVSTGWLGRYFYEDHPVCFNVKDLGTSNAYDVRKAAYHDVFSGAFGHTYGCHDIWQMYAPNRTPINGPHHPWYVAIDLPGSAQMKFLRALIESRPMFDRVPDKELVTDTLGTNDRILATRGSDYIFVYSTQGKKFTLNTSKISGQEIVTYWLNPRNGEIKQNGKFNKKNAQEFIPPTSGYGHDWILIVDDIAKNYPLPDLKKSL